jgi:hypothetical protein
MNKKEVQRRRHAARRAVLKALDQEARDRRERERAAAAATSPGTATAATTPQPAARP